MAVTPQHIGIILDGNRRWARAKGLNTFEGHKKGYERVKEVAKYAHEKGVKYLTVYIFSTENWKRSKKEVNYLMDFAYDIASNEANALNERGARLVILGMEKGLSPKLNKAFKDAQELTKNNTEGTLCVCFNYGGQQEIADAATKAAKSKKKISIKDIDKNLYHPDVPPVDMVIRTSGEQRLSNFMLWRASYSELYFVKKHLPDLTKTDFQKALDEYAKRQRRFGS